MNKHIFILISLAAIPCTKALSMEQPTTRHLFWALAPAGVATAFFGAQKLAPHLAPLITACQATSLSRKYMRHTGAALGTAYLSFYAYSRIPAQRAYCDTLDANDFPHVMCCTPLLTAMAATGLSIVSGIYTYSALRGRAALKAMLKRPKGSSPV